MVNGGECGGRHSEAGVDDRSLSAVAQHGDQPNRCSLTMRHQSQKMGPRQYAAAPAAGESESAATYLAESTEADTARGVEMALC